MSSPARATAPGGRRYSQQLARTIRVAGNMAITLAVIGPAASVFAIGSVALGQQGSGAFLAFLIAALVSACLAVGWAELGAMYPTAGGLYGIVARVLGRRAGFLALVLQLVLFVIVPSAFALAAGQGKHAGGDDEERELQDQRQEAGPAAKDPGDDAVQATGGGVHRAQFGPAHRQAGADQRRDQE